MKFILCLLWLTIVFSSLALAQSAPGASIPARTDMNSSSLPGALPMDTVTSVLHYPSEKGCWMLSGSADITAYIASGNDYVKLALVPNAVYFIEDRIGLGLDMNCSWEWTEQVSLSRIAFGPKGFFVFRGLHNDVHTYLGLSVDYLSKVLWFESTDPLGGQSPGSRTASGIMLKGDLGFMVASNQNLGFLFNLGISHASIEDVNMTTLSLGVGITGFFYRNCH